jgi:hypothetical protein
MNKAYENVYTFWVKPGNFPPRLRQLTDHKYFASIMKSNTLQPYEGLTSTYTGTFILFSDTT